MEEYPMSSPLSGATPSQPTQSPSTTAVTDAQRMAPATRSGPAAGKGSVKKGVSSMEELKKVAPQFLDAMMKSMASAICSKMKASQDRQKKISRGL